MRFAITAIVGASNLRSVSELVGTLENQIVESNCVA